MAHYEIVSKLQQIMQNLPAGVEVTLMEGDIQWRIEFTIPRDLTSTEISKILQLFPFAKVSKIG
jgi:hypothetical protein